MNHFVKFLFVINLVAYSAGCSHVEEKPVERVSDALTPGIFLDSELPNDMKELIKKLKKHSA